VKEFDLIQFFTRDFACRMSLLTKLASIEVFSNPLVLKEGLDKVQPFMDLSADVEVEYDEHLAHVRFNLQKEFMFDPQFKKQLEIVNHLFKTYKMNLEVVDRKIHFTLLTSSSEMEQALEEASRLSA